MEMRILIVEDHQRLVRQLKKDLDEQGHMTLLAFDEREGPARQGHFEAFKLNSGRVLTRERLTSDMRGEIAA